MISNYKVFHYYMYHVLTAPIYFTLNGTVYRPGDTILITDIGSENNNMSDPGSSLVCDTTNVNTQYCIDADGGGEGEWLDPDGTIILNGTTDNFYITCFTHQIRLNRRNDTMSPTGVFTCEVPSDEDDMMPHTATITIGEYSKQMFYCYPKEKNPEFRLSND